MKVLAAMSGGVDSSVAAARMVDAGHEVVGVHMALSTRPARCAPARGAVVPKRTLQTRAASPMCSESRFMFGISQRSSKRT